jgi:hypothetical protein
MNDKLLWDNFEWALDSAFKDTNKVNNAAISLEKLQMQKSLTKYISKFNELRRKAGWDANVKGTIYYFCKGLTKRLLYSMLKIVGPHPITLKEWQQLAIKHHNTF